MLARVFRPAGCYFEFLSNIRWPGFVDIEPTLNNGHFKTSVAFIVFLGIEGCNGLTLVEVAEVVSVRRLDRDT